MILYTIDSITVDDKDYNVLSTMARCRTLRHNMVIMVSAFLLSDIVPATQFLDMPTNTHALESL